MDRFTHTLRTLVIGYGNLDRGDDGVAFDVVNLLRRQLGVKPLDADETGLDDRGGETGAVFVRQLVPELALDVGGCERLVFVDAHVAAEPRAIVCVAVRPEARLSSTLSHTLPVEGFLWLVQAVTGRAPEPSILRIIDDNITIVPAPELWGRRSSWSQVLRRMRRGGTSK